MRSVVAAVLLMAMLPTGQAYNSTDIQTLTTRLFTGYNKLIRPVHDQSHAVKLNVHFFLIGIIDFDIVAEKLKTAGYLAIQWTDQKLKWDPSTENGIKYLKIPQTDLWNPDYVNTNTLLKIKVVGDGKRLISIMSDGTVIWMPGDVFETTCNVDVSYFPYDTQKCSIDFFTYGYDHTEVETNLMADAIGLESYEVNGVWDIIATATSQVQPIPTFAKKSLFEITMKRRTTFATLTSVLPSVVLTILVAFAFCLPAQSGEKVTFCITMFLTVAVYITWISDNMPQTSRTQSTFVVYLTAVLVLVGLSVVLSAMSVYLVNKKCCVHSKIETITRMSKDRNKANGEPASEITWSDVARLADKILFVLFAVVIVILNIAVLVRLNIQ